MATASQDIVSPIRTEKPELIFSAPSINSEPVELDSTPASADKMRARRASRDELLAELGGEEKEVCIPARSDIFQCFEDTVLADWATRSASSCCWRRRATRPC